MALLYEINSVNSLVQACLALLEASDQFLMVAAASSTLYVSSGRTSLDGQLHPGEGLCLSTNTIVSLESDTSHFGCLDLDWQKLSS